MNQHASNTSFLKAAGTGDMQELLKSIQNDCDVYYYDNRGSMLASEAGHLHIVKYLAEEFNSVSPQAVAAAIIYSNLDVIDYLIKERKMPIPTNSLCLAENFETLRHLLVNYVKLYQLTTATLMALQRKDTQSVDLLIEHGYDIFRHHPSQLVADGVLEHLMGVHDIHKNEKVLHYIQTHPDVHERYLSILERTEFIQNIATARPATTNKL